MGLVKPQFECGASALCKNGIVSDKKQHKLAIKKVADAGASQGFSVTGITTSPITGGDGNVEYILKNLFNNGYDGFLSLEPHLGNFEGLADLELDDKMERLPKSGIGTYTMAYAALCEILDRI